MASSMIFVVIDLPDMSNFRLVDWEEDALVLDLKVLIGQQPNFPDGLLDGDLLCKYDGDILDDLCKLDHVGSAATDDLPQLRIYAKNHKAPLKSLRTHDCEE